MTNETQVEVTSLSHNPDAQAWAAAFKATFPDADEGLMLGWFANAMMAMHDHLMQKHEWRIQAEKRNNALAVELRALDAKATAGPWGIWFESIKSQRDKAINELVEQVHATEPVGDSLVMLDAAGKCPAITGCGPTSAENAALIVALRNNLPAIIAALEGDE